MEIKSHEIKNVVGLVSGDVIVDVDIRFITDRAPYSQEERLSLEKTNRDLGSLAWEIKQEIREKIRAYFNDSSPHQEEGNG